MPEGKEVREVVNDPLARREGIPEQRLALSPVNSPRAPRLSGIGQEGQKLARAAQIFGGAVADIVNKGAEDAYLKGQMLAQQGKTVAEIGSDHHTQAGFQAFSIRNDINRWYQEVADRTQNDMAGMSIQEYRDSVAAEFKSITDSVKDPRVRNMVVQMGNSMLPRLAATHTKVQNDYNRQQTVIQYKDLLKTHGTATDDNSKSTDLITNKDTPHGPVRATSIPHTGRDIDTLVRTIYGEAGQESAEGQSAVAHVILNRVRDKRWGNSPHAVAMEEKQFSAWNTGAGGNSLPRNLKKDSAIYKRIEKIAKAALRGESEDPTGGATHYYSPRGMDALVRSGFQTNKVPRWLKEESQRSNGTLEIGGHIFAGRSSGVARPAGIGGEGSDDGPIGNSTKELILKYDGLGKADRAQAVAEAMVEALDNGDDRLFNDGGGLGVLSQIGASSAQVGAVRAAKRRFDTAQQARYDGDLQKSVRDIVARAGRTGDADQAQAELEALAADKGKSDKWLTSIVNKAATVALRTETAKNDPLLDTGNRQVLTSLYGDVRDGKLTAKEAQDLVNSRADLMGLSPKDVMKQLNRMEQAENALRNEARSAARAAAKKAQKRIESEKKVETAIGNGDTSQLTSEEKQMAVEKIRQDVIGAVNTNPEVPADEREGEMLRMTQQQYAALGLVDNKLKGQLRAGITIPVDSKGNVTEGALDAYETYVSLRNMAGLPQSYVDSLVDTDTKALLETALDLDAGNLNSAEAIGKAHTQMAQTLSPEMRDMKMSKETREIVDRQVSEYIDNADSSFWSWLIGSSETGSSEVLDREIDRLKDSPRIRGFMGNRVAVHLAANPNLSAKVATKMAADELQGRATFVGGNVLFAATGRTLKQDMGLTSFGKENTEHMAVTNFIRRHGANPDMWGDQFNDSEWDGKINSVKDWYRGVPEYHVEYNPQTQVFTVDLFSNERDFFSGVRDALGLGAIGLGGGDAERTLLGQPRSFKASTIGEEFKKSYTPLNFTGTPSHIPQDELEVSP